MLDGHQLSGLLAEEELEQCFFGTAFIGFATKIRVEPLELEQDIFAFLDISGEQELVKSINCIFWKA